MDVLGNFVGGGGDVLVVRFRPNDNSKVYLSCADGSIRVHNAASPYEHTGTLKCSIEDGSEDHATGFRFLDQKRNPGELVACYTSGKVRVWHGPTAAVLGEYDGSGSLTAIDVSPGGERFAVAGEALCVDVFSFKGKEKEGELGGFVRSAQALNMPESHSNRVQALKFHPTDPNVLFSSGWDRQVIEWDLEKMHVTRFFSGPYICGDALDVHPDGEQLLTASYREDNTVELWKRGDPPKRVSVLAPTDGSKAYGCQFRPGNPNYACVTGVAESQLRLIEVGVGKSVGRINTKAAMFSCSFSSDGGMVACGGVGGKVFLAKIRGGEPARLPDRPPPTEDPVAEAFRLEMHKRSIAMMRKSIEAEHESLDLDPIKVHEHDDSDSD